MTEHKTVLYTRAGCHLCDEALEVLERHRLEPALVDVDDKPELVERFGEFIPVVEIDGVIRFRGRVDERLLVRLLRADS